MYAAVKKKTFFIYFLFLLLMQVSAQQTTPGIDSARKVLLQQKNDSTYLQTCFFIAEEYMGKDMYDSAQVWLTIIAERVPLRKPSFFNFYLSIDQAETYYYNGLKQMDLQESERALRIAIALNDSILLATGYNFTGLAYMDIDSLAKGIQYLKTGIPYAKQPPYPPQYLSASKPHHLYGNLAEAYYKSGMDDSARYAAFTAKKFAGEIPWPRGIAVADNMLGIIFTRQKKLDSAILFHSEAISVGLANNQPDVSLISYAGKADCYEQKGHRDSALALLKKGFELLKEKTFINNFFSEQFLRDAVRLYKKMNEPAMLITALEMRDSISRKILKRNDAQIYTLVKGSVSNEIRAANLEVTEAKHKQSLTNTRLILALVALASMIILFFLYRRYQRKQLREMEIRNRISRDLHDDIGATLSSIKIYGELADSTLEKDTMQSKKMIGEITGQAKELMSRMGDVIWSMKPVDEEKNTFSNRLKNFSNELLTPKGIECEFDIDEKLSQQVTDPVARKNILLIIKEAMNNIAKYSGAKHCKISLRESGSAAILLITDDGRGIDMENTTRGNGLDNMKERAESLGGKFEVKSSPGTGVAIQCKFPIAIFSHST
ncbi:MAG: sensor histidine kinase [Ferruginibacter sp.]